jgi:hypothetical protein
MYGILSHLSKSADVSPDGTDKEVRDGTTWLDFLHQSLFLQLRAVALPSLHQEQVRSPLSILCPMCLGYQ